MAGSNQPRLSCLRSEPERENLLRIWDVNPGYLNRQSLLGEHRELHAIVSIIVHHKSGYAHHPETRRWRGYGWALRQRHRLLAEEMALRGYREKSPVRLRTAVDLWPEDYVDAPERQFHLLAGKYQTRPPGRIPLPRTTRQLWRQHRYSIMARDPDACFHLEQVVASTSRRERFADLAGQLTVMARRPPSPAGVRLALRCMGEQVPDDCCGREKADRDWSAPRLLGEIQRLAREKNEAGLLASTALSELMAWL